MSESYMEPWLRGSMDGVPPAVMPLFFSFAQVRDDLMRHTAGLSAEQVWRRPGGNAPLGFHIRHIGGSVDRMLTYLEQGQLSGEQMAYLNSEGTPGAPLAELMAQLEQTLQRAEARLRLLETSNLQDRRYVGRKRLAVTVLGLLVHIAEHTQRHLGQAITTAKFVRNES
jgi:uncharacterized damage-inducible protein DinB